MGYENESAREQRRKFAMPHKNAPRERRKFGLFWFRHYTPTVIVWETFFRTRMGERHFAPRLFLGGLVVLGIVQTFAFQSMLGYDCFEIDPDKDFYITSPFDWAIAAYLIMGSWHLVQQRILYNKGQASHSYYMGRSRLRPIGKLFFKLINFLISLPFRLFKAKPFQFGTDAEIYFSLYLLEPLTALILTLILGSKLCFDSMLVLCVGIMGAAQLWWQNIKLIRENYLNDLDKRDSQRNSEQIQREMMQRQERAERAAPPPLPKKVPKSMPSLPKKAAKSAMPNVEDALKNLNPNLKDLGNAE